MQCRQGFRRNRHLFDGSVREKLDGAEPDAVSLEDIPGRVCVGEAGLRFLGR